MSRLMNDLTVYVTQVWPQWISCDEGVWTTQSFANACDSQPAELMRPLRSVEQRGFLWLIIYDSFLKSNVTIHDFWFVELTAVSSECNGRKTPQLDSCPTSEVLTETHEKLLFSWQQQKLHLFSWHKRLLCTL